MSKVKTALDRKYEFEEIQWNELQVPAPQKAKVLDIDGNEVPQFDYVINAKFFGELFVFRGDNADDAKKKAKEYFDAIDQSTINPQHYKTSVDVWLKDNQNGPASSIPDVLEINVGKKINEILSKGVLLKFGTTYAFYPATEISKIVYRASQF